MTTEKSSPTQNSSRDALLRPDEVPSRPFGAQARDYAQLRGHYEATQHLDPMERSQMARPARRALTSDYPEVKEYEKTVTAWVEDSGQLVNDIANDRVAYELDLETADPAAVGDAILSYISDMHLEQTSWALLAATEEFEAVVAYAYHVSRMSYGQISRATGKSKSTIVDIVKRARHLEVLAPED